MAELEGKKQRFGEVFDANVEAVEASVEEFCRVQDTKLVCRTSTSRWCQ
jgi:hypothetical protein